MNTKKYGYFGGTFDPIHNGHLFIAGTARDFLNLDKIYFIPTSNPPHKENQIITADHHRLEMLRLALNDESDFKISEMELKKNEISYSVDTLRLLRQSYKRENIFWIIGADSLTMIDSWRESEEIFKLSQVVVYPRKDFPITEAHDDYVDEVIFLDSPNIEISASEIRQVVNKNLSISNYVSKDVESYILQHNLYKSEI